jgi:deoxyhypusine synthase
VTAGGGNFILQWNVRPDMSDGAITTFLKRNYRHFNAAALVDAADAYKRHLHGGGWMFLSLAGAMSTAELGISLAEMIRRDKIHAVCCTGANLEEDIFNLIAHNAYERVKNYRDLTPADELDLLRRDMNRVTDTCIPEHEAIRKLERAVLAEWVAADRAGERYFPHEFLYKLLREGRLRESYEIDVANSWLYAAMEKDLPVFVPGWEDSTLGNMYTAHYMLGDIKNVHTMKTGIEYLLRLAGWYADAAQSHPLGFFQIGGGIAGDFAICVVPLLREDVRQVGIPLWGYYCQISDSTTSYGSYSGAHPNEKITWGKLDVGTPKFMIESDATIVAPLVFAIVLGF